MVCMNQAQKHSSRQGDSSTLNVSVAPEIDSKRSLKMGIETFKNLVRSLRVCFTGADLEHFIQYADSYPEMI